MFFYAKTTTKLSSQTEGKKKNNLPLYIIGTWLIENSVSQIYRFRFFLHVHRSIDLRRNYAPMSQYFTHRIQFSTCCNRQRCGGMSAAVICEILFYPCLSLDAPHVLCHVVGLLHQRENNTILPIGRTGR